MHSAHGLIHTLKYKHTRDYILLTVLLLFVLSLFFVLSVQHVARKRSVTTLGNTNNQTPLTHTNSWSYLLVSENCLLGFNLRVFVVTEGNITQGNHIDDYV